MRRRGHTLPPPSGGSPTPIPFDITTTSPLPDAYVGDAYSVQLTTNSSHPPQTFYVTSGSLPDGITLDSTGLLHGLPTTPATSTFRINCIDASSYTASAPFSLTVNTAPPTEHWRLIWPTSAGLGLSQPPGGYNDGEIVTPQISPGTAPTIQIIGVDEEGIPTGDMTAVSLGDLPSNPGAGEWPCSGGSGSGCIFNTTSSSNWEQFFP